MNNEPDYAGYVRCMEEVKRRLGAIDDILVGNKTTSYKYTNVEFVALQFRKIFELIILATLASHHHLFEGLVRKLSKEWQISKVVAIVKKKNPEFYPAPPECSGIRARKPSIACCLPRRERSMIGGT